MRKEFQLTLKVWPTVSHSSTNEKKKSYLQLNFIVRVYCLFVLDVSPRIFHFNFKILQTNMDNMSENVKTHGSASSLPEKRNKILSTHPVTVSRFSHLISNHCPVISWPKQPITSSSIHTWHRSLKTTINCISYPDRTDIKSARTRWLRTSRHLVTRPSRPRLALPVVLHNHSNHIKYTQRVQISENSPLAPTSKGVVVKTSYFLWNGITVQVVLLIFIVS